MAKLNKGFFLKIPYGNQTYKGQSSADVSELIQLIEDLQEELADLKTKAENLADQVEAQEDTINNIVTAIDADENGDLGDVKKIFDFLDTNKDKDLAQNDRVGWVED